MALRHCLLAAAILSTAAANAAGILRFAGAPLTRSVQNEADAAIDRACAWLAARQNPDGSWNGGIKATAVCLLALAGSGEQLPDMERETIRRGVDWLKGTAASDNSTPEETAWRDMALVVLAPGAPDRPAARMPWPADCSVTSACAIRERAALLGLDDENGTGNPPVASDPVLALLCASPNSPEAETAGKEIAALVARAPQGAPFAGDGSERAWWFAHAVNRILGGEIPVAPGTEPTAWRETLANAWTVSQQIDGRGRGFWPGSEQDTAFAILLLKEL